MRKLGKVGLRRQKGMAKLKPPADGRCEFCGKLPDFRGLQPHHKIKRSHQGDESRKNITWICGKCHDATEGIKDVDSKPQWSKL